VRAEDIGIDIDMRKVSRQRSKKTGKAKKGRSIPRTPRIPRNVRSRGRPLSKSKSRRRIATLKPERKKIRKESRRAANRSRSSTPRQRAVREARRHPMSTQGNALGTLAQLNAISWDVTTLPENGVYRRKTASSDRQILERVLRRGEVRLLLPVVRNGVEAAGKERVAYEVIVKGRDALSKDVRFGDILHKIHAFYMTTKVTAEDLENVSLGGAEKPSGMTLNDLRFADFIRGQTKFAGLSDQDNGTYLLKLE
jgi:hypothetical protein